MRVITGSARGKKLLTLEGQDVRPTVARVKEGIFSAIQFDIEGRKVLDLFAGSGQLGVEALSRGAQLCVFVDNSARSLDVVKENLKSCGLLENARVVQSDALAFINGRTELFDIVFLDPPYAGDLLERVLKQLEPCLSAHGMVLCEHAAANQLQDNYGSLVKQKDYRYGKVCVRLYRREPRA